MKKTAQVLCAIMCLATAARGVEYGRPFAPYYSQCGQDKYVNEKIFCNKRDGFFIEIGAHDGISFSNTYYFEKFLGWTGICIEPNTNLFGNLVQNRKALCINACISNFNGAAQFLKINGAPEMLSGLAHTYDPRHLQRIESELACNGGSKEIVDVAVYTLQTIVKTYGLSHIDLLSIDTEGSELTILQSVDLRSVDITVIIVENNYNDHTLYNYLLGQGYILVAHLDGDCLYTKIAGA